VTVMAVEQPVNGAEPQGTLALVKERHKHASDDRRSYEGDWKLAQAFLAGRQWVGLTKRGERRVVELPNPHRRERHTTNMLDSYLWTVLGKLTTDDFKPNITWRRTDQESVAVARQSNRSIEWAWDDEFDAEWALMEAFRKKAVYGTAAIRVRPDFFGPPIAELPVRDGDVITDLEEAYAYVAEAQEEGRRVQFKPVREARLLWEPLGPFNLLPPPGVHHEKNFPWLIIERPVSLDSVQETYGAKAAELREENIRSVDQVGLADSDGKMIGGGRLRGHLMLKTMYEYPTKKFPDGRTVVWASDTELEEKNELPYVVNRQRKIGIVLLKYHPLEGQFWAQGLVHPLLGPQRQRNRAATQRIEMKDRNLGRVYVHKGTFMDVEKPQGGIMEVVNLRPGADLPRETQGVPPGPWIQQEVEISDSDMDKIAGLHDVSLGRAPAQVAAFAAMALLKEEDDRRFGPVLKMDRMAVRELVKISLAGVKRYWLPNKQIPLAGEDGVADVFVFNASKMPDAMEIKIGSGSPLPSSMAAEIQKIFDLFDRSISSGQPLPLDWLYESLAAGKALPIPKREMAQQQEKANLENTLMLKGEMPPVHPTDNDELHAMVHSELENQAAMVPELQQLLPMIQQHKLMHLENARRKRSQVSPAGPGGETSEPPIASLGEGPRIGQQAGFGPLAAAMGGGPQAG
jgi:hypothetical protein